MAVATWNGIPIPRVAEVSEQDELRAEEGETAGGYLRRDIVGYRRSWRLRTTWMRKVEADAVLSDLRATVYGFGTFWTSDFGDASNTVEALADPPQVTWAQWDRNYRRIEINIRARKAGD